MCEIHLQYHFINTWTIKISIHFLLAHFVNIAPLDPIYGETSVFILCDKGYQPIGTTFAVSNVYLLTAKHNLANPRQKIYTIASSLNQTGPNEYFRVRVHAVNAEMDWAVLQLEDRRLSMTPIPISLLDPIPRETRLKIYHCPVVLYNNGDNSILTSVPHWVQYWGASKHHIATSNGLYSGSSGAPYILPTGEVIGIHCEMVNQAVTVDSVQVSETASQADILSAMEILSASINSNTMVSGSQNVALKISRCSELVRLLGELEIIH